MASPPESFFHRSRRKIMNLLHSIGFPTKPPPAPKHKRRIHVNIPLPFSERDHHGRPKTHYPPNKVRTSKYTALTFIPKNLLEQFRRLANLYFLMTVILQIFPQFGVASPILAAMPLIIILTITGFRDALEDWKRHQTDNMVNSTTTLTLSGWVNANYGKAAKECRCRFDENGKADLGKSGICHKCETPRHHLSAKQRKTVVPIDTTIPEGWTSTAWRSLRVGDFIHLKCDDRIPADILLLSTSDPHGLCFVETKGLDGETNLKSRECLQQTTHLKSADDCRQFKFIVESEPPTINLYSYSGTLFIPPEMTESISGTLTYHESATYPINIQNILLRGSVMRNTEWAIGLVLFTGRETKVLLNAGNTPSKRSKTEKLMNPQVAMNFLILLIMCVICAGLEARYMNDWVDTSHHPPWIGDDEVDAARSGFFTFWASMIMLQNVVPISLYITIEGVKTIQAYFIYSDIDLYHSPTDDPCTPKSWNIADDLGQIEYIFSDKTGTLTQNKMEFMRCSIGGVAYGHGYTDVTADAEGINPETRRERMKEMAMSMAGALKGVYDSPYVTDGEALSFVDGSIYTHYASDISQREEIQTFFTLLSVCHTVLPPKTLSTRPGKQTITYAAQSPDEQALVTGAKDFGIAFLNRQQDLVIIDVMGKPKTYKILHIIEFTSSRKRMSVVCRDTEDNRLLLFTKGADSVIYERLAEGQMGMKEITFEHLERFAEEGLRTLVLAYRVVGEDEYRGWSQRWVKASCALEGREAAIEKVAEEIEKGFMLVGASAIEDKLQSQVPEAISLLRSAGIKIWVLTGDKMETAINISFASNLLTPTQTLIILKAHTSSTIIKQLQETLEQISNNATIGQEVALVIDGEGLRWALGSPEGQELLVEVGRRCRSVVCCRVSPKQKAQVVKLVKKGVGAMCAAIGDGANDVSMIQEAHIGIGISGQEGLQAAMAADYVIAQFRFLAKLVLVHGRWSYFRTSETVMNFFYKNMVWVFSLFWYQFFCAFSAEILFDYTYLMFFNLIFTSLPPLILGIFDQDIHATYALSIPPLYTINQSNPLFTARRFLLTVLNGLYQSVVCFFIPYAAFGDWDEYSTGKNELGLVVAMCVIMTVDLGVGLSIRNWTWIVWVVIFGSVLSFVVYVPIWSVVPGSSIKGLPQTVYSNLNFWATIALCVVVCLAPRVVWKLGKNVWKPDDLEIIRERQKWELGVPVRVVRVGEGVEQRVVEVDERVVGRRVSAGLERGRSSSMGTSGFTEGNISGDEREDELAEIAEKREPKRSEPTSPTIPSPTRTHAATSPPPLSSIQFGSPDRQRPMTAPAPGNLRITTSSPYSIPDRTFFSAFPTTSTTAPFHTSILFMDSRTISHNTGFAFSYDDQGVSRDVIAGFQSKVNINERGSPNTNTNTNSGSEKSSRESNRSPPTPATVKSWRKGTVSRDEPSFLPGRIASEGDLMGRGSRLGIREVESRSGRSSRMALRDESLGGGERKQ